MNINIREIKLDYGGDPYVGSPKEARGFVLGEILFPEGYTRLTRFRASLDGEGRWTLTTGETEVTEQVTYEVIQMIRARVPALFSVGTGGV